MYHRELVNVDWEEAIALGATDPLFYNRAFFPQTFRSPDPQYAKQMWDLLESSQSRFVNLQLYRDSSKTTSTRSYMSRGVSYATRKVVLLVAASSAKAEMSVGWIKRQVERKGIWQQVFNLQQGTKWTDTILEVINPTYQHSTWFIAFGLTGKHRGINIDDYRPDLIIIDDIVDEEIAASDEQRNKAEDLVLGSLLDSLVPRSENPQAKMVMLQTPQHPKDPSMKALKDPMWTSMVQGCWTKETENLPIDAQESCWPERYPSEDLRRRKREALRRNKASLFAREKECKLVTPETSDFRTEWLNYFDGPASIEGGYQGMWVGMAIDPVPPPTERQIATGLKDKDFECLSIVGVKGIDYYLLDYSINRGHDPEWTISEFFRLVYKWNPKWCRIESVAYQKTLAWLIGKAMQKYKRFVPIHEYRDKRSKRDRIVDALSGIASHGHLHVMPGQAEFIDQFGSYPNVEKDDVLDSVSMAIDGLAPIELEGEAQEGSIDDFNAPLDYIGKAP